MPKIVGKVQAKIAKPKVMAKFTNRGPAGLLNKVKLKNPEAFAQPEIKIGKKNRIRCDGIIVDVKKLKPDPNNARLHPNRNMEAIKNSLNLYGQMVPLVVRKQDMMIAAGNGRFEAATQLGWTQMAVSIVPMTDAEFAGYALADNRTAELAAWDQEVLARMGVLLAEAGHAQIGWTIEEIAVLRKGDFVEPPADFPEVDENIETEHLCPKCGYQFSGGETVPKGGDGAEEE